MITSMGDVMRECYRRGWITTRDGNISLRRTDSNIMYITPSGWRKTIIHPEHILVCKISGDEISLIGPGNSSPSGELEMHFQLQYHRSYRLLENLNQDLKLTSNLDFF